MSLCNETHAPALQSWISSANHADTDFPIQNLPFGIVGGPGGSDPRVAVAIGDQALDLRACYRAGLLNEVIGQSAVFEAAVLNPLLKQSCAVWSELRRWLSTSLRDGATNQHQVAAHLMPMSQLELLLPADITDYTDFYCSLEHATNVGRMFRPDEPLTPNFKTLPIGYHGRASSVVVSGTAVRRPSGQWMKGTELVRAPTKMLDYELELGAVIGGSNPHGTPISLQDAENRIFGLCLLNDWSARDIQSWEYRPLGPFLSKSFATTVSGWVVTLEALAPFRSPARPRAQDDPELLPYLDGPSLTRSGFNIDVEALIATSTTRQSGAGPQRISRSNAAHMYWTFAQMVTHHASNGCPLRSGDLLGSGTISGPEPGTEGCLLELTSRGKYPLALEAETRSFLEDGDEITFHARCTAPGARSIGFGQCSGLVLPAHSG